MDVSENENLSLRLGVMKFENEIQQSPTHFWKTCQELIGPLQLQRKKKQQYLSAKRRNLEELCGMLSDGYCFTSREHELLVVSH